MHACTASRRPIVLVGIMLYAKVSPLYRSALLLFTRKLHCLQSFEHMSALLAIKAWVFVKFHTHIRASVDALCRDGPGEISRDRLQRGRLTRQGTTSLASKAHRYDSQTHL